MVKMGTLIVVLITFAALAAKADTVTTRDSSSWNGTVIQIEGGVLQLKAAFPTGTPTLNFGANYLRSVEFNTTTYNPGANPTKLLPKANGKPFSGTVYMVKAQQPQNCTNITIFVGSGHLLCDGQSLDLKNVIRLLINTQ